MSRWNYRLLCLALCWLAVSVATVQAQPEQLPANSEAVADQTQPQSGEPQPGEPQPEEPQPEESSDDADQTATADNKGSRGSSTNKDDFKPKEEISEDFPVSLPADI